MRLNSVPPKGMPGMTGSCCPLNPCGGVDYREHAEAVL